ncbi:MAG: riboflavin biosynthesis protein RibF [Candidatus Eisenbacteria bacterium]|nr:riboflavin biosynthesis protein RibF [Candidatus Eisenbacteria bacterium]
MRIARTPGELATGGPADLTLTVGNFDGLHLGHQAVVAEMQAGARGRGSVSTVVTFDPHPAAVVHPGSAPCLLTPTEEKLALLAETGVDVTLVVEFTADVAGMDAVGFLDQLGVGPGSHLVLGYDFHMGKDRACGPARLYEMGSVLGYGLDIVPPVLHAGVPVSSSRIRQSVEAGEMEEAGSMLGRPYAIVGQVVSGASLGGQLGFPTANLDTAPGKLLPADGVYFATVETLGGTPGLLYVGSRPTFGDSRRAVEVHVIDFSGDLYGAVMTAAVHRRIRSDRRFGSADELRRQMDRDLAVARAIAGAPEDGGLDDRAAR